jgi:hypothetical protein
VDSRRTLRLPLVYWRRGSQQWLSRKPRCHPKVALANAVAALTARMSARQRQRMDFVEAWFDPDRDETPEGVRPNVQRYS